MSLLFGLFSYFRGSVDKPYILSLGIFDVRWIGVFVAISLVVQSAFISQFDKLKAKMRETGLILVYAILSSLPLLFMSIGYGYVGLIAMLAYYLTESYQETMLNSFSQKHIPSNIRATTLSSMKVYVNIGSAVLGLLAGQMFNIVTIRTGLMIAFGYTLFACVGMYLYHRVVWNRN